jgi:hypothetical protein
MSRESPYTDIISGLVVLADGFRRLALKLPWGRQVAGILLCP